MTLPQSVPEAQPPTTSPGPPRERVLTAATALVVVTGLALVFLLTGGGSYAFAADKKGGIGAAGQNVADVLGTWSAALFGGVTGIMAIYYLVQRKIGPALGFVALAMLVGGFVFAPELMQSTATSVATTVLK